MTWIKLTSPKRMGGQLHPSGTHVDLGFNAAKAMVAAGDAVYDQPDAGQTAPENESSADSGDQTGAPEPSDAGDQETHDSDAQPVSVESVDWQQVTGVGPATEQDILETLDQAGAGTVQQVQQLDLSALPVDPELVDPIGELLEEAASD